MLGIKLRASFTCRLGNHYTNWTIFSAPLLWVWEITISLFLETCYKALNGLEVTQAARDLPATAFQMLGLQEWVLLFFSEKIMLYLIAFKLFDSGIVFRRVCLDTKNFYVLSLEALGFLFILSTISTTPTTIQASLQFIAYTHADNQLHSLILLLFVVAVFLKKDLLCI